MRVLLASVPLLFTAVGLAACADTTSAPFDPSFAAVHGTLPVPAVTLTPATTDGVTDVLVAWTWSDDVSWDMVTFAVFVGDVAADELLMVKEYAGEPTAYTAGMVLEGAWTDIAVPPGSYKYCVKVLAKAKSGRGMNSTTYHAKTCEWPVVIQ